MSSEDDISPLLSMRQKLDNQIAAILEKVAGIRKKRDVLQNAIDVLRSGDEELSGYSSEAPTNNTRRNHIYNYNSVEVEAIVLNLLADKGPMRFRDLLAAVTDRGQDVSKSGLRTVIQGCPTIVTEGFRDQTKYRSTVVNTVAS